MTVKLQQYIAKYNYTFLPLLLKISNIILFCSPSSIFSTLIHFSSSYTSTPPTVPSILPPPASPTPHLSPPPIPPPPSLYIPASSSSTSSSHLNLLHLHLHLFFLCFFHFNLFLLLFLFLLPPLRPPPSLLTPSSSSSSFSSYSHLFLVLFFLPLFLPYSSSPSPSSLPTTPSPPPQLLLPPLLKVPEAERCFDVCSISPDSCWMVERDLREETVMVPYLSTVDTSQESCRGWGNERRGGK